MDRPMGNRTVIFNYKCKTRIDRITGRALYDRRGSGQALLCRTMLGRPGSRLESPTYRGVKRAVTNCWWAADRSSLLRPSRAHCWLLRDALVPVPKLKAAFAPSAPGIVTCCAPTATDQEAARAL